ncbi:hypothetical protein FE845_18320 [Marinobacter sp. 1-4A]|uniref:hypothetical protein n=1 Tax=Marinobacter sp. 1-4A TaxID=2582919 RepID=UPI001907D368|nr:hypothetical protein [Marinobacter sp. 1-4A]MBK1853307.1 hypothetical protein [Marinobacter sp. 1-4A]
MAADPKPFTTEALVLGLNFFAGGYIVFGHLLTGEDIDVHRFIDALSAWLQVFGFILLSFEFLRRPLIDQQSQDFEVKRNGISESLDNLKGSKPTPEKHAEWFSLTRGGLDLERRYEPVRNFEVTARQVCWAGFVLVIAGYILQLATA